MENAAAAAATAAGVRDAINPTEPDRVKSIISNKRCGVQEPGRSGSAFLISQAENLPVADSYSYDEKAGNTGKFPLDKGNFPVYNRKVCIADLSCAEREHVPAHANQAQTIKLTGGEKYAYIQPVSEKGKTDC